MSFYDAVNNASTTTPGYMSAAGSIDVASGDGALFGTPTADAPRVVSTFLADGTPKGVYACTGRTTDTLTGLTLLSGTDATLVAGSLVKACWTAEAVRQITAALGPVAGNAAGTGAAGSGASALGHNAQAAGDGATASGRDTIAVGQGATAEGYQSLAAPGTGQLVTISGAVLTVAGGDVSGDWTAGHALGLVNLSGGTGPTAATGTVASVAYSAPDTTITLTAAITAHAAGTAYDLTTAPIAPHAEGSSTTAVGRGAHAEGENTTATAEAAHAEGYAATASGQAAHAENEATASGDYSHAEGHGTALGGHCHAEGGGTADGDSSHAEGAATASGDYSHAEGEGMASGTSSHAEGGGTADGNYGHAEGSGTVTAASLRGHAEGDGSTCSGNYAHAEGSATASGQYAHAEGDGSLASGDRSHAENSSTASGARAHAEGGGEASGAWAHAEGQATASGGSSHAEGFGVASGDSSHAEGGGTASGISSHAGGAFSLASLRCQWVRSDDGFGATGDAQHGIIQLTIATADATPTALAIGGGQGYTDALAIRPGVTAGFLISIVARKTDGSAGAHFLRQCLVHNEAGTTALVGAVATVGTDNNAPGWSVAITADDALDALAITVTGAAATTIRWVAAAVPMVEVAS